MKSSNNVLTVSFSSDYPLLAELMEWYPNTAIRKAGNVYTFSIEIKSKYSCIPRISSIMCEFGERLTSLSFTTNMKKFHNVDLYQSLKGLSQLGKPMYIHTVGFEIDAMDVRITHSYDKPLNVRNANTMENIPPRVLF